MHFRLLSLVAQLYSCVCAVAINNPSPRPAYSEAIDNGTFGSYPVRTFATEPDLTSPRINWLQWSPGCDDGLLYFITPRGGEMSSPGPMILDGNGDLVWTKHFDNSPGGQAYDLKVQQYQGQQYLTFWLGDDAVRGHGSGYYYMLNSSYDIVRTVGGVNGLAADLHEFVITTEDTALMTMYDLIAFDLTAFRDFDPDKEEDLAPNFIWDGVFQEVDIQTGELVFQWRASDHLDLVDSYHDIADAGTFSNPYDWFHINSISKDELGNYLVSARYTHSVTYIDGSTGDILWILGGKRNDFMDLSDGSGLNFAWQHNARFHQLDAFPEIYTPPTERPGTVTTLLTIFDNGADGINEDYGLDVSRGLLLELTYSTSHTANVSADRQVNTTLSRDPKEKRRMNEEKVAFINGTDPNFTVRVIKSYENPRNVRSSSQGSLQVLPASSDGGSARMLIGYGMNAVWTEFDSNGTVLCDAHFGAETSWERGDIQSYRAYKFAWSGWPRTSPVIDISDDDYEVYVSWNGATEVVDWLLQASNTVDQDNDGHWINVVRIRKEGFETAIPIPSTALGSEQYLRVLALGSAGSVFENGRSNVLDRGYLSAYFPLVGSTLSVPVIRPSSMKLFLAFLVGVVMIVASYDLCRRCMSWRHGRRDAGPIRWRKGVAYHFIGDA